MQANEWSLALEKFWIEQIRSGAGVLLLDPELLLKAAQDIGFEFPCADDATEDFLTAAQGYLNQPGRRSHPWRPSPLSVHLAPFFLLLIGLQVLAAFHMADDPDGEYSERAYYIQLDKVTGWPGMKQILTRHEGGDHQELWRTRLDEWLTKHGLPQVPLPDFFEGAGKHVCLPKSQTVLRSGDLNRLPLFFHQARYRPGHDYRKEIVEGDVRRIRGCSDVFSTPARRALNDEQTLPIAVSQICAYLNDWDGSWELPSFTRRRSGQGSDNRDRWWLAIQESNRRFHASLGAEFVSGESNESTVEQLGEELQQASSSGCGGAALADRTLRFRFDGDNFVWQQVNQFEAGDRVLIAVHAGDEITVDQIKSLATCNNLVSNVRFYTDRMRQFDRQQCIVLEKAPVKSVFCSFLLADPFPHRDSIDKSWHSFLRTPKPELIPTGGLRFGREAHWVAGAGPGIRIKGKRLPRHVDVNGEEFPVNGRIFRCRRLSEPGQYTVTATIDGLKVSRDIQVSAPESFTAFDGPNRAWLFTESWPQWNQKPNDDANKVPWLFGQHAERFSDQQAVPTDNRRAAIQLLLKQARRREHAGSLPEHPIAQWLQRRSLASVKPPSKQTGHIS
ncbi:MAG: hypothetical protein R3C59_08605 [Planctomycetaceae bacterium]